MLADTEQEIINAGAKSEELEAKDRVEAEIKQLAALSEIEYGLERKKAAKRLGITTALLDRLVRAEHVDTEDNTGQGRAILLFEPEPWFEQVDGAELLTSISAAIRCHVVLSQDVANAIALWIVHCFTYQVFTCTPRLAITSPEKQCGKTTLLDVLECLVPRPLMASNITASAVFRTVEIAIPTILIDEADTFLDTYEELRGILNSGHRRGGQVVRVVGDNHEPRQFSTHSPAAIAMIGKLPPTLADRSIAVTLRRRLPDEAVKPFHSHKTDNLKRLARKSARWIKDNVESLQEIDPDLPSDFANRPADNWRPLFAIAAVAGGDWPSLIRRAAEAIELGRTTDDQSAGVQLLADIKEAFRFEQTDRMTTASLLSALVAIEDRPWSEWKYGKPMTKVQLAGMLRPFGVRPTSIRRSDASGTVKGYYKEHFDDVFSRYLTDQSPKTSLQIGTAKQLNRINNLTHDQPETRSGTVPDRYGTGVLGQIDVPDPTRNVSFPAPDQQCENANNFNPVSLVPAQNPENGLV